MNVSDALCFLSIFHMVMSESDPCILTIIWGIYTSALQIRKQIFIYQSIGLKGADHYTWFEKKKLGSESWDEPDEVWSSWSTSDIEPETSRLGERWNGHMLMAIISMIQPPVNFFQYLEGDGEGSAAWPKSSGGEGNASKHGK